MTNFREYSIIHAADRAWVQDNSGVYATIAWMPNKEIRIDLFSTNTYHPIVTIQGENVSEIYKTLVDFCINQEIHLSTEHAMYIGSELEHASNARTSYVQL